jgi:dihydroorotate dehydrogenase electron transfer subunit
LGLLDPTAATPATVWDLTGRVLANFPISDGLRRLDLELPRSVSFRPGQFAMLDPCGPTGIVFRRPFSILAGDDAVLSFLYRVVGRGTEYLSRLIAGDRVHCLAPLGRPFPVPDVDTPPVVLVAGGVGLPPLYAWFRLHGKPDVQAFFGARDGGDVPWALLADSWHVSVDRIHALPSGRSAHPGTVVDLVRNTLFEDGRSSGRLVLACGPKSMLMAVAELSREHGWGCHVSIEEHMGCGYGVCKGCVVPVRTEAKDGWRHANCCTEGPVFDASELDWRRFTARDREAS